MQSKGGYTLLYFVKSKNDTKCKNFVDLLCSYVNTFILVYFLRFQEGGGATAPLAPPPKSATGDYSDISTYDEASDEDK